MEKHQNVFSASSEKRNEKVNTTQRNKEGHCSKKIIQGGKDSYTEEKGRQTGGEKGSRGQKLE